MNLTENSEMNEMILLKFFMSQNYPNPFTEKTKIKYCVAYKTKVNISLFNSKGEIIEELVKEELEASTYEVEFQSLESNDKLTDESLYYWTGSW